MFKKITILAIVLSSYSIVLGVNYEDYFTNKSCRIDYVICGNSAAVNAYVNNIKQETFWGGRKNNLSSEMNLGQFRFRVMDSVSNQLIYSNCFSTLFEEWQSTPEAKQKNRSFEQTITFPYPLRTIKVLLQKRLDFDTWSDLNSFYLNPSDKLIQKIIPNQNTVKTLFLNQPATEKAIDIAIIAEGYTSEQKEKFYADAKKLGKSILNHEPFKKYKSRINFYAVATISTDSDVSVPNENIWRNTALDSHFYTFYSERYLTTFSIFKLYDYAAMVPYDAIYVMANTKRYGGGGFFNFYALASGDSNNSKSEVIVHEFGHEFAGLADEYFYDNDALTDLYDLKKEPWEPNITSLINFDAKWKNMLPEKTAIPTPLNEKTKQKIGVFEGGGYLKKGMYRPCYDCRMRTNAANGFCPVCEKAIIDRIKFLTE